MDPKEQQESISSQGGEKKKPHSQYDLFQFNSISFLNKTKILKKKKRERETSKSSTVAH